MSNTKKPTAFERSGFSNIAQLGGQERSYFSHEAGSIQRRARALYVDALGLRGADRHAALSLSRHFGGVDGRCA